MRDFIIAVNFVVFRFFRSRGESMPDTSSMVLAPLMIGFNVLSLAMIFSIGRFRLLLYLSKVKMFLYFLPLFLINYFMVYHGEKHDQIFLEFANSENFEKKCRQARMYITFTIIFVFGATVIGGFVGRWLNFGHL